MFVLKVPSSVPQAFAFKRTDDDRYHTPRPPRPQVSKVGRRTSHSPKSAIEYAAIDYDIQGRRNTFETTC